MNMQVNSVNSREDNRRNLSRREMLTAATVSAAVLAGKASTGHTAGAQEPTGSNATDGDWDEEADLLVCGTGTAAFGALLAAQSGAKVLVAEKADRFGGTSSGSGGVFWLPLSYPQVEAGTQDSREEVIDYMRDCAEGRSSDAVIESFVDNAAPFLSWTHEATGMEFTASTIPDYLDGKKGFKDGGRSVKPTSALDMWQLLQSRLEEEGADVRLNCQLIDLVSDADGAVVGAVLKDGDAERRVRTGAVLLGTGGFEYDREMRERYLPFPLYASNAVTTNTGDGHRAAAHVGADLALMDLSWGLMDCYPNDFDPDADILFDLQGQDWARYRGHPNAIVVNSQGKRFADEAADYASFRRAVGNFDSVSLGYSNIPAYLIIDSAYLQHYKLPGMSEPGGDVPSYFVSSDSIEGLADKLGVDPDGLTDEVERFNGFAHAGIDQDFHRGEKQYSQGIWKTDEQRDDLKNMCLGPIDQPPFYGCLYLPMTCGTCGGVRINENAQAVDVDGNPISGLYACGNCAAAITGSGYVGAGGTLAPGAVMGYVAVRHALSLD